MAGFTTLQASIELRLTDLQKSLKAEIDEVKVTLDAHERRFARIDDKLAEHDARFDAIDARFDAIEADLAIVKADVSDLKRDARHPRRGL